ncbi:AAA family ATPase, partial [Succinivibrio sp.]|uniref:AAA family ATPase n=1 Tax=Succinivibrio sp. TaxID=2053619 RepID=UPI0025F43DF3
CFNEYAGFTEDELDILIPKLVDVAKLGVTTKEIIERMKPVYDGYCFSAEADKTVYNSSMCLYFLNKVRQKGVFLNPEDYLDPASDQDGSKLSQLFNLTQKETAEFIIDTYLQGGVFYVSKLSENINLNQVREYSLEQLLSMLYYLGYLTIDREKSSLSGLALKIPNRFMSKLFARCTIDFSFKNNTEFKAPKINLSALTSCEDDISSFAESCSEFLSRIMNNQVLSHMNEMALNLALYAKLETMPIVNTYVKMQQSVQVPKEGERFPDLVITVNKGLPDECIYLIELKYLKKTEARDKNSESILKRAIKDATAELTAYKSAIDFKGRNIKAYAMVFAGTDCVYCQKY